MHSRALHAEECRSPQCARERFPELVRQASKQGVEPHSNGAQPARLKACPDRNISDHEPIAPSTFGSGSGAICTTLHRAARIDSCQGTALAAPEKSYVAMPLQGYGLAQALVGIRPIAAGEVGSGHALLALELNFDKLQGGL